MRYAPDRGHVVWLTFANTRGHEQRGRRPALIVSPQLYNADSGLALVCPITTHAKGYPFEVLFDSSTLRGVVLVDQLRSIDWRDRRAQYADRVTPEVFREVQEKLKQLIE